jgi:hypothetical protein
VEFLAFQQRVGTTQDLLEAILSKHFQQTFIFLTGVDMSFLFKDHHSPIRMTESRNLDIEENKSLKPYCLIIEAPRFVARIKFHKRNDNRYLP